jgi:DNA processing protein
VTIDDEAYPARLRAIAEPPPVLFVRGNATSLNAPRAIAIVGTRHPTEPGRRVAARIADAIARLGAVIVSGLAIGIDGAAHAAVVSAALPTVAVLGSGHDRLFPKAHRRLAAAVVETGGAIVSELPPDAGPTKGTFPRRNRLISGLAEATVVVEAAQGSGALITARWALEQGRGCFVVPGSIDAPASAGCLAFLREFSGEARIVAGVAELIDDLELVEADESADGRSRPGVASREAIMAILGRSEAAVAAALADGATTVDELADRTNLAVSTVLGTLTMLEIRGLVVSAYGRYRPAGILAAAPPRLP